MPSRSVRILRSVGCFVMRARRILAACCSAASRCLYAGMKPSSVPPRCLYSPNSALELKTRQQTGLPPMSQPSDTPVAPSAAKRCGFSSCASRMRLRASNRLTQRAGYGCCLVGEQPRCSGALIDASTGEHARRSAART